ncbi:MAG: sugar ABC transporter permease [Clostridiales bacterium]|nr:sugar ABC transporter permease [Clostridiales bacterium]
MKRSKAWDAVFLGPSLLALTLVVILPFFQGIIYSLTNWNGVRTDVTFVGFANYREMFQSVDFLYSFLITLLYTAINVVLVNVVAFLLALLVTSQVKGRNLYRAAFFVPNLIGGIVLGYTWQFMFNVFFTSVTAQLGLGATSMITSRDTVILGMSIVNTWQYAGYIMLIFVAGIQSTPVEVMEAATVDGAGYFRRVTRVLIPMIANAFTVSLFLTIVNSFKMFDLNVALTNGGPSARFMGQVVNSSQLLTLTIYNKSITTKELAKGQAMSVVLFIVLVVFSLIQVTLGKRREVEA